MGEKMSLEKIIEIATQVGLRTALETIHREKRENLKQRYDRRLRNTKLLLQHYREFVTHADNYICAKSNIHEVLDEIEDENNEELYIESISKSAQRTAIILAHIRKMLCIYYAMCQNSLKDEDIRRYNVIKHLYIEDEKTVDQLAYDLHIDRSTVYRDRDEAVKTLSCMIFGIDGIKIIN